MPIDILLNSENDTVIKDGDFAEAECTRANQRLLMLIDKGELREYPMRGVGVRSWLLEDSPGSLNAEVKRELEADGMKVLQITQTGSKLQIEATYE